MSGGQSIDFDPERALVSFKENAMGNGPMSGNQAEDSQQNLRAMIGGHLQTGDLIARNFARRLMPGRGGSAFIVGDGVGHPRERLLLLGIKDMEDRADQHRMRGLLPMVAPLEHAFGVDQDVGDILHIAHVIGVGSGTTASSQFRPIATARLVGDRTAGFRQTL